MRIRGLLAILVCSAGARQLPDNCGTHPLKLQEEIFLHRQSLRKHRAVSAPRAVTASQDIGNIAVLDATGGVVIARNQFDLDRQTLVFIPTAANATAYRYELSDPSYD